jgi:hypothetical protein
MLSPFAAYRPLQGPTAKDYSDEFNRLANDFISSWNSLMALEAKGRWDVKLARECEAAFNRLTKSVGWRI